MKFSHGLIAHRHTYTDTQRHTHTDTQRHTQTHKDTHRHTQTHKDTHRHTHRHTKTHTDTHTDTHRHTHTDTQRHTKTHKDTHRHTQTHTDTARTGPLSPARQILWSGQRNAGVPPLAPSGREVLSIPGGGGEPPAALPGLGLNRSPTWFPMWRERLPLLPDSNPRAVNHTCSPSLALLHWLRESHVTQAEFPATPHPNQGIFPRTLSKSDTG